MRRGTRVSALLGAAACCASLAFAGWSAPGAHAAGTLGSFSFRAGARGMQGYESDPVTGARNGEGEVPETETTFDSTGNIQYGLASVAWPGPLAGNAGTLALVLRPELPPEATAANYPVRAEARSGQQPPRTTYDALPGAHMEAVAEENHVGADALVNSAVGDPGTFGPAEAHSNITLADGKGQSQGRSLVQNVGLANGVVRIGSVQSSASAVTDGVTATGAGATIVNDVTIAGVPATIDEDGVHFGPGTLPLAVAAANQAMQQAGIVIVLSAPAITVEGPGATVDAGSLIVSWTTSGSVITTILGGAQAAATAAPGEDPIVDPSPTDPPPTTPAPSGGGGGTSAGGGGSFSSSGSSGGAFGPGGSSGASASGTGGAGATTGNATSANTPKARTGSPSGLPAALAAEHYGIPNYVVPALLAMVLFGLAMRQLSDKVLGAAPSGAPCTLDDLP